MQVGIWNKSTVGNMTTTTAANLHQEMYESLSEAPPRGERDSEDMYVFSFVEKEGKKKEAKKRGEI